MGTVSAIYARACGRWGDGVCWIISWAPLLDSCADEVIAHNSARSQSRTMTVNDRQKSHRKNLLTHACVIVPMCRAHWGHSLIVRARDTYNNSTLDGVICLKSQVSIHMANFASIIHSIFL